LSDIIYKVSMYMLQPMLLDGTNAKKEELAVKNKKK